MPETNKPFASARFFLLISAVLHLFAFVLGGFTSDALMLIPFGILYILCAAGLARGWRWLAYITFFLVSIFGIVAFAQIWGDSAVPRWWYMAIVAADWVCAAALFAGLWSKPAPASAA